MKGYQQPQEPNQTKQVQDDAALSPPSIHHHEDPHKAQPEESNASWIQTIKIGISLGLLGYCLFLIVQGIRFRQTPVAQSAGPTLALGFMVLLIVWLGLLEGGQGSLVGLQPVSPQHYQASHPIAAQSTKLAHAGDNLNRFIVGRQFLVVLVVYALNLATTSVEGAIIPGCNPMAVQALLSSGLASMFITVILGQLSAEVNATNCMLDFINNTAVYSTTVLCLAMEASGLLHAVYVLKWFFSSPDDDDDDLDDQDDDAPQEESLWPVIWYRFRVVLSMSLLAGALAVTYVALQDNETSIGLPPSVSLPLFVALVCGLGMMEAMQIAVFAVVKLPKEALEGSATAQANCALVFQGQNFKAFLIGRQICVTTCMFLLARLTTTTVDMDGPPMGGPQDGMMSPPPPPPTVMGVAPAVQAFFNTGLPGALITTIVASLYWRIVAANYPVWFMNCSVVNGTIRLCLALEATGAFSSAWMLADGIRTLLQYQPDDWYLQQAAAQQEEEQAMVPNKRSASYDEEEACETSSLLTSSDMTRSSSDDSLGGYESTQTF